MSKYRTFYATFSTNLREQTRKTSRNTRPNAMTAPTSLSRASAPLSDLLNSPNLSSLQSEISTDFDQRMEDAAPANNNDAHYQMEDITSSGGNKLSERVIPFIQFPHKIRQRVYHFLSYPVETAHEIQLTRTGPLIEFKARYNVNYTRDGSLTQPWNWSHGSRRTNNDDDVTDGREKRLTPQFFIPLLLVNMGITAELYDNIYAKCFFDVTLNGWRYVKPVGCNHTSANLTTDHRAFSLLSHCFM
jgi:hypothetical protein